MSNLLLGILTISFCIIGYLFSWSYWTKDNYKIAILLLVICGFALRIYTSTDFFLHPWDELIIGIILLISVLLLGDKGMVAMVLLAALPFIGKRKLDEREY